MIFSIKHNEKNIGQIELDPDSFSIKGIGEQDHKKILQTIFELFYEQGISQTSNSDFFENPTIFAKENFNKFILEADLKLNELGYSLK